MNLNEYAVYKGDTFIFAGTVKECADYLGIQQRSFRWYLTPSYQKRLSKRKKSKNYIVVIKLDEE